MEIDGGPGLPEDEVSLPESASADEGSPVEPVGADESSPTGEDDGLEFDEIDEPPARWRVVLRAAAAVLLGAAVFTGGFFLHAAVNWPDLHPGPHVPDMQNLQSKVTPHQGFVAGAKWNDLLPQLVAAGAIDIEKFKAAAAQGGQPLTDDQVRLLTAGGDDPITIDMHNAKFVLNALWAVGLATDNPLLKTGPLGRYKGGSGNLASTGGWTLGKNPGPTYLSTLNLLPLTPEQQQVVDEVANGVYRPCCDNPTAFPDCNHGIAALGLAEIMAYQGASADDIFRTLKAFNAYWFPDQYLTLAVYYDEQGTDWEKVNPREVLDKGHSSGSGWKQIDAAVKQKQPFGLPQNGGGGCSA